MYQGYPFGCLCSITIIACAVGRWIKSKIKPKSLCSTWADAVKTLCSYRVKSAAEQGAVETPYVARASSRFCPLRVSARLAKPSSSAVAERQARDVVSVMLVFFVSCNMMGAGLVLSFVLSRLSA